MRWLAGWLVSGCYHFVEIIVVSEVTAVIICNAQSCHLASLMPPFYQSGDHFVSLGAPWEAGAERKDTLGSAVAI